MIIIFLVTLGFMLLAVGAMAMGVILTGRRLKGSCGGLASGSCACGENGLPLPERCAREP